MNRMTSRVAAGLLVLCLLLLPRPSFASGKGFLWKVSSETAAVYLLGSVHFMRRDAYPLDPVIEDTFRQSDILAVEADINDLSKVSVEQLLERALYPAGDSIDRHISPETLIRLRQETERLGLSYILISRQRPWVLALTLTSLELVRLGFDPAYGIDLHFLDRAQGKKVVELESVSQQVDLLSGFPDEEQEQFLRFTLDDMKTLKEDSEILLRIWKAGDMKGLEGLIGLNTPGRGDSPVLRRLFFERNEKMAAQVEEFLKKGEKAFVVVGAGHLVGKQGLIEILRAKGYQVEQQ